MRLRLDAWAFPRWDVNCVSHRPAIYIRVHGGSQKIFGELISVIFQFHSIQLWKG